MDSIQEHIPSENLIRTHYFGVRFLVKWVLIVVRPSHRHVDLLKIKENKTASAHALLVLLLAELSSSSCAFGAFSAYRYPSCLPGIYIIRIED